MAAPISYDHTQYDPPAPILPVIASRPLGNATTPRRELRALGDTGADLSCIPIDVVSELDLAPVGEIEVSGYDGRTQVKPVFAVSLAVAGLPPRIFRVIPLDGAEETILGRDVLNLLRIQLDGPAAQLTII